MAEVDIPLEQLEAIKKAYNDLITALTKAGLPAPPKWS